MYRLASVIAFIAAVSLVACSGGNASNTASSASDAAGSAANAAATAAATAADAAATAAGAAGAAAGAAGAMAAGAKNVAMGATGDAAHGKALFTQNCSGCHGATGAEGGVGPKLAGEKARKDTAGVIAQIKNPKPPMPKLYPSPLNDKDVADLAAYVESL